MKRITTILSLCCLAHLAYAQVAQWLIHPAYDKIEIPNGTDIILTQGDGVTTLWNKSGRELARISDDMNSFSEGLAVTTRKGEAFITAIYDANGTGRPVSNYQLGWGHPYFHDGWLLVHDGQYFHFMDAEGTVDATAYAKAYPFSNGYASISSYENLKKRKSPYKRLLDKNLKTVTMTIDGKRVDNDDVEFISSVSDKGQAIVVLKHKLYFFDATTQELKPVYPTESDANSRNHAKIEEDVNRCITDIGDTVKVLKAKCGSIGDIEVAFDKQMKLTTITYNGQTRSYYIKRDNQRQFVTQLKRMAGEDGKLALYWNDEREMLPPQFTSIPLCFEDKAFVCLAGKYGLLKIHPDENFRIRLNKSEPVAFRHKHFFSNIRLDMPAYVSSKATSIEMPTQGGCRIDKVSKETKETSDGNYVQYDCRLDIPQDITEEPTELTYQAYVLYEGLRSGDINVTAKAWHNKYYNVDVKDNDYSISDGNLSFTFDVSTQLMPGEAVYPHEARLLTDTLASEITERVSETRYKCKVYNLNEGMNIIVVQILEEGCPPCNFTFEVVYTKPRERSGGRGKVTIKKKHLDI